MQEGLERNVPRHKNNKYINRYTVFSPAIAVLLCLSVTDFERDDGLMCWTAHDQR
jgi:hypothetical protein